MSALLPHDRCLVVVWPALATKSKASKASPLDLGAPAGNTRGGLKKVQVCRVGVSKKSAASCY